VRIIILTVSIKNLSEEFGGLGVQRERDRALLDIGSAPRQWLVFS